MLDTAFGQDRHGRTAYRLRAGCTPVAALSWSAWVGATLIGSLQSWPVAHVGGAARTPLIRTPLIMVGPVAVAPDQQQSGIGRALMRAMLDAAHGAADGGLMMIGDPDYYGRFFDFTADATGQWTVPGPVERHRLLARGAGDLAPPAAAGFIVPDPARIA